jgi:sialidase-1
MIKTFSTFLLLATSVFPAWSQDEYPTDTAITVFSAGDNNPYASIRIPALISLGKGQLMAFAEGRYKNTDQGQNDIIMSFSKDKGKTWSKPKAIAKANGATYNNPCPVYDAKTRTISVVFQRYPEGVHERDQNIPTGWDDPKCLRNFIIQSKDGGRSWTKPEDITPTTKRPEGVDIMASGPNAGAQITSGPHKGRIAIPMNEGPFGKWALSCIYSDDGGKNWKLSEPTSNMNGQVNETSIAETDNGGLVIVARHWGSSNCKRITWSEDGGQSWSPVEEASDLFCDNTQNSLLSYSLSSQAAYGNKSRLLFSGPSESRRIKGQVAMSYDGGKTWPVKKLVGEGGFAYSSLAPIEPGSVGLLYEENSNQIKNLKFVPISISWLTDGEDTGMNKKAKQAKGATAKNK